MQKEGRDSLERQGKALHTLAGTYPLEAEKAQER